MPLPLPLLPKTNDNFKFPPKCPLNTVNFIQLRKFQIFGQENIFPMTEGWDLLGKRKKFIKEKLAERETNATKKPEIILSNP